MHVLSQLHLVVQLYYRKTFQTPVSCTQQLLDYIVFRFCQQQILKVFLCQSASITEISKIIERYQFYILKQTAYLWSS